MASQLVQVFYDHIGTLISTLISIAIGALVTWLVARHYYVKAASELADEAKELRRLSNLMLRGLESGGVTKYARDSKGDATGIHHETGGNLVGGGGVMSAKASADSSSPSKKS